MCSDFSYPDFARMLHRLSMSANSDNKGLERVRNFPGSYSMHPAGLDEFVGGIDLTYLRDSLTNIILSP